MMNLKPLCQVLEDVSLVSSKNGKMEILRKNESIGLRALLNLALNPYIHFGVSNFDQGKILRGTDPDFEEFVGVLNTLSARLVTGNEAVELIKKTVLTQDKLVRKWLIRIVQKDLKAGIGAKIVNKVYKDLIPEFQIALCDSLEDTGQLPEGEWVIEPKLDGLRCITIIDAAGNINFLSRKGKQLYNLEHIETELKKLNLTNVVFDGEMFSKNWNDTISILHTQNSHEDSYKLSYHIFDMVELSEWQTKKTKPYWQRINNLTMTVTPLNRLVIKATSLESRSALNYASAKQTFESLVKRGYEGAVLKELNSSYPFKRSKYWLKWKTTKTYDIHIVGFLPGSGRHKGKLGAFICDFQGHKVRVGSGLSDEDRQTFWINRNSLLNKTIEVKCQEVTKDGSLRFPVFIRLRGDK